MFQSNIFPTFFKWPSLLVKIQRVHTKKIYANLFADMRISFYKFAQMFFQIYANLFHSLQTNHL